MAKENAEEPQRQNQAVYDAHGLFNYMSKQTPDEFNARAIATGKDWSVISVTGCSRGWVESKFDTAEVSRDFYGL
ncbi:TPA: hypothetical protein REW69_001083 [Klebsiella pneumoniae]|nr:hypothetical protein [Klebsiella pneumoniae]